MDDLQPGGRTEETLLVTKHAIGSIRGSCCFVFLVVVVAAAAIVAAAAADDDDAVVAVGVAVVDDVDDYVHVTLISVLSPPTVTVSNIT